MTASPPTYCEPCITDLKDRAEAKAKVYAAQNCKITKPLPEYDSQFEFRASPEDYDHGARESYTPNAYMCHCRHNCTNYEDLIASLDRNSLFDHAKYRAIRDRITDLLESEIHTDETGDAG